MKEFEQRLERLEAISEEIRSRDVPLQKAMELFEEGMGLSRNLEEELRGFERRVEILSNTPPEDGSGAPVLEDFE